MMKMYGTKMSTARRCLWLLEELGQKVEVISMNFKEGENKKPEYLALNPNGKVPTLVDGNFVIWESSAINYYLAEKFKSDLLGTTPEERALVQQWSYWVIANLAGEFETLIMKNYGREVSEQQEKMTRESIARFLTVLDGFLKGKTYLVAERFTLADLHVASIVNYAAFTNYDLTSFVEVTRWLNTIKDRPAFKQVDAA
jgi:glutathione S-transferase